MGNTWDMIWQICIPLNKMQRYTTAVVFESVIVTTKCMHESGTLFERQND